MFFLFFYYFGYVNEQEHISPIEQYVIDYVRDLRKAKNLSQEDIGNIIGKSKSFIGNIESLNNRAKYNLTHINLLADHFNLSPKDFLPEKVILKRDKKKKTN
ncbi:helix-turn-helix transcriptional regulator [Niabella sp. 3A5MI-3]|nr:helix-turn-helix transcriptional regulator [Niabella beijingensis]MBZ4188057.1 helix-turn-helix transcriptional regulator [Niabella beijingensis]